MGIEFSEPAQNSWRIRFPALLPFKPRTQGLGGIEIASGLADKPIAILDEADR